MSQDLEGAGYQAWGPLYCLQMAAVHGQLIQHTLSDGSHLYQLLQLTDTHSDIQRLICAAAMRSDVRTVVALSEACAAFRSVVAEISGDIKLQGMWNSSEVAGQVLGSSATACHDLVVCRCQLCCAQHATWVLPIHGTSCRSDRESSHHRIPPPPPKTSPFTLTLQALACLPRQRWTVHMSAGISRALPLLTAIVPTPVQFGSQPCLQIKGPIHPVTFFGCRHLTKLDLR